MKVYIVTTGEYSDYTIQGACSTQALADAAAAKYDDASVGEWEVDEDFSAGQVQRWECFLNGDGGLTNERSYWNVAFPGDPGRSGQTMGRAFATGYSYRGCSNVSAEDARRLAAEARTQHLREALHGR